MIRVLLLGGTAEAGDLARALDAWPGYHLITSLAGRTTRPGEHHGELRSGGFGGVDGLASYLREQAIDVLIDATHPFAAQISRHAAETAARTGIPHLRLLRPAWTKRPGDRWIDAIDCADAAAKLPGLASRVFLTTGHRDLDAFAPLDHIWFLIRTIEPVAGPRPRLCCRLTARGPFAEADELTLFQEYSIDAVVTKASGGEATYAKIAAARRLGLPVIMIQRPPPSPGPIVQTTDDALTWLRQVRA
ncbi:MAG: cobalt-precorrin-6A reductase [Alphaproteobacteria bacterium]